MWSGISIDKLLRLLPKPVRPYASALLLWLSAVLFSAVLLRSFGPRASAFCSFVLLIVLLLSAWLGYGPGVLGCLLVLVVAPRLLAPHRTRHLDPINLGLVVIVMLLI